MIRRAAVVLAALLAGCGGDGPQGDGPLVWAEKPYAGTPSKLLPEDRVVLGTVRHDSLRRVKVHYRDVRLIDAGCDRVAATVRFTNAPGHGLYPPTREPDSVTASEGPADRARDRPRAGRDRSAAGLLER